MQWSLRIWLRDYTRMTKAEWEEWIAHFRRHIISIYTHSMSLPVYTCVFVLFPPDTHQYQPFLINQFWISHCLSFEPSPLAAHPAAAPANLMVFSHINLLIKSKFQWWINLPELMRWSAACCYQSTCCQMIVSCWNVWHYEVYLEAQLSYNGPIAQSQFSALVAPLESLFSWNIPVYPLVQFLRVSL